VAGLLEGDVLLITERRHTYADGEGIALVRVVVREVLFDPDVDPVPVGEPGGRPAAVVEELEAGALYGCRVRRGAILRREGVADHGRPLVHGGLQDSGLVGRPAP